MSSGPSNQYGSNEAPLHAASRTIVARVCSSSVAEAGDFFSQNALARAVSGASTTRRITGKSFMALGEFMARATTKSASRLVLPEPELRERA